MMNIDSENTKPNILYVDDIKANLMLFEASFDDVYNIFLAESGDEALKLLKKEDIHVLVSDQNMPGMTGNELLEIVTSDYPDVMRFMITAYTDYDTVVEAINKGHLFGFFNKPYNNDEVKHYIERSLEVRTLRLKNKEMLGKLEAANEMMLNIDQSKTNFLSSLTEEIRQPINKIMTAVHMIKDKVDSNDLSELLQLLDVSVNRLEDFSEQAKQLSLLSNPDYKIQAEPVSLKEIVEIGIIEKGNALQRGNIDISLGDDTVDEEITGDFDLLQGLFSALLGYLVERSKENSSILVQIQNTDDTISLEIKTDNPDFSKKEIENLSILNEMMTQVLEQDLGIEILLAYEIMKTHNGRLFFIDEQKSIGFMLRF